MTSTKGAAGKKPPATPSAAHRRLTQELDDAISRLDRWPCAAGTPQLPSDRGFAYLGNALARQGFIVVSVGLNGVNAGELTGDDRARAAVIDRHLLMWSQLDATGAGPLAGRFRDAATGAPVLPDFRGRVDLADVGLLGHSRGGRGVMYAAAADHAGQLPPGVRIRAVFGLAAAGAAPDASGAPDPGLYRLGDTALMTWSGTCDQATGTQDHDYNLLAQSSPAPADLTVSVAGAEHDFLNEQWSPASHQVLATDDAVHQAHDRRRCEETSTPAGQNLPSQGHPPLVRELTEGQERRVATTYVSAFFDRYLLQESSADPILDGQVTPDHGVATATVRSYPHR